jgi:hypothetical protein
VTWLLLALLLACVIAYATWRLFLGYPRPPRCYSLLAAREVAFIDSVAAAVFPPGGGIPISGADAELPSYVDSYLGLLPAHLRRQVRAMLMLFEQATFFFPAPGPKGRRRFSGLSPEQRMAVLTGWSESRVFLRRLAFTALRAVLTMGYLGHPRAMRAVNLAPYQLPTPICEADLLYPRIGAHPDSLQLTRADLTPPSDGTPLCLDGPLHPDYAESPL